VTPHPHLSGQGPIDECPQTPSAAFYDFEDYEALVVAAKATDPRAHIAVLLGGEAGLRCGEIMALEWRDVNFRKGQICVERSEWNGHVTTTKGGRLRYVPMTGRLVAGLRAHRHLQGARVLCREGGQPSLRRSCRTSFDGPRAARSCRGAGIHMLRHTFCSHLAMRGAPARAIQELARAHGPDHDAAVHAFEPGHRRQRDQVARSPECGRVTTERYTTIETGRQNHMRVARTYSTGTFETRDVSFTASATSTRKPAAASRFTSWFFVSTFRPKLFGGFSR